MKVASLRGARDGGLAVVSRDLSRAALVPEVAPTLQALLDDWSVAESALREIYQRLNAGEDEGTFPLEPSRLAAPLPRPVGRGSDGGIRRWT